MCTLIILYRPNDKWPLLVGGNRDEMVNRPWLEPANHWSNKICAGKDILAGGTWFGINNQGMVASVLNRINSLGNDKNKKSRGIIPIDILNKNNIEEAINYVKNINTQNFKSFNLFFGNNQKVFWAKGTNNNKIILNNITPGMHFLDSYDLNSLKSPKFNYNLKLFKNLKTPNPDKNSWISWKKFFLNDQHSNDQPLSAINIKNNKNNYGTLCTNFVALPNSNKLKTVFLFKNHLKKNKNFYQVKTL